MKTRKIIAFLLTFMLVATCLPANYAFAASQDIDATNVTESEEISEADAIESEDVDKADAIESEDVDKADVTESEDVDKANVTESEDVSKANATKSKNVKDTSVKQNKNARYGYGIDGLYYKRTSPNNVYVYWNSTYSSYYDVIITDNDTYEEVATFRTREPNFSRWLPAGSYNVDITDEDYNFNDIDIYVPGMAVKNFRANATSGTSIKLSWNGLDGVAGYQVWKYNRNTKKYFFRTNVGRNATSFIDKGLYKNNTYTYKIRAYEYLNGEKVFGKFSNIASDITGAKTPSFTNKKAYTTSIYLKWAKVEKSHGYNIYRSTSYNGPYKKVVTLKNSNSTSYTNKNLSKGKTYYYKIQSYRFINNQIYRSNLSAANKITTFAHARPNLIATAPNEDAFDSYLTNYYGIAIKNNSGYTMYIQPDAFLEDANYYEYDRNLKVYGWAYLNGDTVHKSNTVQIPPHSSRIVMFYTNDASWYDNYSTVVCKFKLDGAFYKLRVGYDYGWEWWRV